jgi:hypothetical protein
VAIIAAVILVAVYLYKQNVTEPFAISKDVRKYLDDHLVNNMETAGHVISHGDIHARSNIRVHGRADFKGGSNNNPKKHATHFPWKNGQNYIRGSTTLDGDFITSGRADFTGGSHNNPKKAGTHFPWKNGQNYIRGSTTLDGDFDTSGRVTFAGATVDNPKKYKTHFANETGKNHIRGSTEVIGSLKTIGITNFTGGHVNNHKKLQSHFPFKDGQNYIRGTTNLTGKLKGNSIIEAPVIQGEVLRFGKENALWEENGVPVFGKIKSSEFADNGTKIRYNMVKESKFDIKTGTFVKDDQSYFNNYNWSK